MDPGILALLILIVLVSGLIAVMADELGRRIGKKRLVLHRRIRPKTTARIVTFFAGMVVSLITIGGALIVSKPLRDVLLHGRQQIEQQRADLEGVKNQLGSTQQRLDKSNQQLGKQQKQIDDQTTRIVEQKSQIDKQNQAVKSGEAKVASLRLEITAKARDVATKQKELTARQADLRVKTSQLNAKTENFKNISKEYAGLSKQYHDLDVTNQALEKQNNATKLELNRLNAEKATVSGQLEVVIKALKKANDDYNEADNNRYLALTKFNEANARLVQAQIDLQQAGSRLEQIASGRINPIIFTQGEEVVRIQLEPQLSPDEARAALNNLMRLAGQVAQAKGATGDADHPVVNLYPAVDGNKPLTTAEQEDMLVRGLTNSKVGVVLVATSAWNAAQKEPLPIRVVAYANPLVYKQGQVIVENRIDGRGTTFDVYNRITDFLNTKVREKAQQDKMIPVSSGDQSFGSLTTKDLFELIDRLKSENRIVRLQAVAQEDIRAGDSLKLIFRIRY